MYSAKVRSDPVKKQQINAQKREAMRRLKMRRKAAEQQTQILATAKDEVEEEDSSKDVPETNADLIHLPIYVEYHQEDAEEPEQVIGQLNDVGEEPEEKQQYTIEEESQLSSQSQPPEQPMSSSEYFPFAAGLADCLQLEDQGKFIAYIEDCAQLYMKVGCNLNFHSFGINSSFNSLPSSTSWSV